ncbi:hypothetical protein AB0K04_03065 [Micromonospora coxensis]|uniref:hypothetical protein n=1 Tax=Micromonospora coxensis TaxID=356852 RepID=UPI00342C082C
MARVDVRPPRRALARRTSSLLAASLAAGLAVALAVAPELAAAAPTSTLVTTPGTGETAPGGEPTDDTSTPPVEPTATDPAPVPTTAPPTLPPDPTTPAPAPTTTAPTTTPPGNPAPTTAAPTTAPPPVGGKPAPPNVPAPSQPNADGLGVRVTTRDLTLGRSYWNAKSTVATLRVTVENTGRIGERVRLGYTLPTGLADAGTAGCVAAGGGSWGCGEWTVAPGTRFTSLIKVRVAGDAWRRMPLSGSVRVTATGPGTSGTVEDNEGFAVLFPPGPPVPGMLLDADEVAFDITGGATELAVRLGNTGAVDATGRVEVVLPSGVSVQSPPPYCAMASPTRTRCDLGLLPTGRTQTLRLPVVATPQAQREAPLAGALIGELDPRSGRTRQMRMSFRIVAAAALATPPVTTPTPTGSQGVLAAAGRTADTGGMSSVQRIAVALIAVSVLLVVLALALATTSLRRRMGGPAPDPTANPAVD